MKPRDTSEEMAALIQAIGERQEAMLRELSELAAAVRRLEGKVDARTEAQIAATQSDRSDCEEFSAQEGTVEVLTPSGATVKKRSVKVEVKAVIAAAAAVAGEMAKPRKTRATPVAQDSGSAWSQQGRVGVVSSHNLR